MTQIASKCECHLAFCSVWMSVCEVSLSHTHTDTQSFGQSGCVHPPAYVSSCVPQSAQTGIAPNKGLKRSHTHTHTHTHTHAFRSLNGAKLNIPMRASSMRCSNSDLQCSVICINVWFNRTVRITPLNSRLLPASDCWSGSAAHSSLYVIDFLQPHEWFSPYLANGWEWHSKKTVAMPCHCLAILRLRPHLAPHEASECFS